MAFGSMNDKESAEMADMNVTPLVDVMLVLLIVFMIAMPVFTSSIQIQLPQSSSKEVAKENNIIRVTIDAEGKYYILDQLYDDEGLSQELINIHREQPESVIALKADQHTDYKFVANLLDKAKQIGISKIGFISEVKSTTTP